MLWGAVLVSLLPISFMFAFSYLLLNRAVDRWFSQPVTEMRDDANRMAFELARSPDLDFKILKIDHGVGVLRMRKENPQIPDLGAELQGKRFQYFYENLDRLPILDYEDGRAWIERCFRQQSNTVQKGPQGRG